VGLLLVIAEGLVEHGADLLHKEQVLVREDVGQLYLGFSVVADYLAEILLLAVGLDSHLGSEDQAEQCVDHGY
jgi:hypothetical protein